MSHLQCLLCSRLMRSAAQQLRAPCVHARQHVRRSQGGCQALRYAQLWQRCSARGAARSPLLRAGLPGPG